MIQITPLSPRAFSATVEGSITREDIRACLDQLAAILESHPQFDILTDVRGPVRITPAILWEELQHLPMIFRMVRALERVAVVADQAWVRAIARAESYVIPGLDFEVFTRAEADHARAWVLRETDAAHPAP